MKRLFLVVFLLEGCTFQSNQIDFILGYLDREPESDFRWQASHSNKSWILTAVSRENLLIFMNNDGDALVFDGWTIRSMIGFDFGSSLITITEGEKSRIFGGKTAVSHHSCGPWSRNELDNGIVQFVQPCEGTSTYNNFIRVDKEGRIMQIDQVISGEGHRIRLSKL